MRAIGYLCLAVTAASLPVRAQVPEPILTKLAIPYGPGTGAVKLDYAGGIGHDSWSSQAIPEAILEVGARDGLEILSRFPLLRANLAGDEAVVGGGQLAMGARYLLTGGVSRSYAISIQTVVEAPTGNSRIVGNATEVMPTVLADWRPTVNVATHSNFTFDRGLGGTGPRVTILEYSDAVAWQAMRHFVPAFEFVGSTNTVAGRTELVALPEVIVQPGSHLEWKAGFQLGLNAEAPRLGFRAQVAWQWGKHE